jgi:hypothetical protein
MARWREIPAQRVLMVSHEELRRDFDLITEEGVEVNGEQLLEGRRLSLVRRKADQRVFQFAEFVPRDAVLMSEVALVSV